MEYLSIDKLENLPTKRLLAYKKKLHKHMWEPEDYVWDCNNKDCFCADEKEQLNNLKKQIELVKNILKNRKHIERR